jgi:hypothetical protein
MSGRSGRGFRHPVSGERLMATQRPGFELMSAPTSPSPCSGDRGADVMHSILDAETSEGLRPLRSMSDGTAVDCSGLSQVCVGVCR